MDEWVRLCAVKDAPRSGEVLETEANGVQICLANIEGELHALDNICPHRQGPLGQGWVEGHTVVCPWHAWAFDVTSGVCQEPEHAEVRVFELRREGADVLVQLS